jgi:hypothetical protein
VPYTPAAAYPAGVAPVGYAPAPSAVAGELGGRGPHEERHNRPLFHFVKGRLLFWFCTARMVRAISVPPDPSTAAIRHTCLRGPLQCTLQPTTLRPVPLLQQVMAPCQDMGPSSRLPLRALRSLWQQSVRTPPPQGRPVRCQAPSQEPQVRQAPSPGFMHVVSPNPTCWRDVLSKI